MRDRLTHAYFGVDLGLVWRVVERDLQALETAVAVLVETSARLCRNGDNPAMNVLPAAKALIEARQRIPSREVLKRRR